MSLESFSKVLTLNDIGKTGSHQAGLHIPKKNKKLLEFFPTLGLETLNPSKWITCVDEHNELWRFRFVYYNNKFHSLSGRRNEFRLTHTTKYLKSNSAFEGDIFLISKESCNDFYRIKLIQKHLEISKIGTSKVQLSGWRQTY
jgi:hypothetical protein